MTKPTKTFSRDVELRAISILMLEQMESSLLPMERIIFLRFLICYGGRKISIKSLTNLAGKIKVHRLALQKAVKNFLEKGLYEEDGHNYIRIKTKLLSQQVSYKRTGRFEVKKSAHTFVVYRYKRFDFLIKLFDLFFKIRISHKQKDVALLLELNYQQWLVLVNLVMLSDERGIVYHAGTYELSKRTGMSRDALLRAITVLFKLGIIRSKLHGSLNNNLLASNAPIYALNLSASIWGEYCRFGTYYFLKLPNENSSIVKHAFRLIEQNETSPSDYIFNEMALINQTKNYQLLKSQLVELIPNQIDFASKQRKKFLQDIQIVQAAFKQSNSLFNSFESNLSRIEFLLQNYLASRIKNLAQGESLATTVMPMDAIHWFSKFIKEIKLDEKEKATIPVSPRIRVETLEELRAELLFMLAQAILRSELLPVLRVRHQYVKELGYSNHIGFKGGDWFTITFLPVHNSDYCDKIYFVSTPGQKKDCFQLVEFDEVSNHPVEYAVKCTEMDLSFEEQKAYGLFRSS